MIRHTIIFFSLWFLCLACGTNEATREPDNEVDSTREKNLVKAEAPDAQDEVQLGYTLPGLDHGLLQSPINIVSKAAEGGMHEVALHYQSSKEKVANLGHTVEVDYDPGSTVTFDGATFDFKQFHFHTPAEHLIDGITYPLEMHMVHIMEKDSITWYLVIGIHFKEGDENAFLSEFLDAIPTQAGQTNELPEKELNVEELLMQDYDDYYHYRGSLTTPPFSETVEWVILKNIFEASPEQIQRINSFEGNNARHIQARYGRKIEG